MYCDMVIYSTESVNVYDLIIEAVVNISYIWSACLTRAVSSAETKHLCSSLYLTVASQPVPVFCWSSPGVSCSEQFPAIGGEEESPQF